jgi:hypothetical protein
MNSIKDTQQEYGMCRTHCNSVESEAHTIDIDSFLVQSRVTNRRQQQQQNLSTQHIQAGEHVHVTREVSQDARKHIYVYEADTVLGAGTRRVSRQHESREIIIKSRVRYISTNVYEPVEVGVAVWSILIDDSSAEVRWGTACDIKRGAGRSHVTVGQCLYAGTLT